MSGSESCFQTLVRLETLNSRKSLKHSLYFQLNIHRIYQIFCSNELSGLHTLNKQTYAWLTQRFWSDFTFRQCLGLSDYWDGFLDNLSKYSCCVFRAAIWSALSQLEGEVTETWRGIQNKEHIIAMVLQKVQWTLETSLSFLC